MFRVEGRYLCDDVLTVMFDLLSLLYIVVSHAICQSGRQRLGANIITAAATASLLGLLIMISGPFQSIKAGEG